jgi:hypothetical protein
MRFFISRDSGVKMAFHDVPTKVDFPAQERDLLAVLEGIPGV